MDRNVRRRINEAGDYTVSETFLRSELSRKLPGELNRNIFVQLYKNAATKIQSVFRRHLKLYWILQKAWGPVNRGRAHRRFTTLAYGLHPWQGTRPKMWKRLSRFNDVYYEWPPNSHLD